MATTTAVFRTSKDAGQPLDITQELTASDLIRYTVPAAGGPFVTGAPQSNTLTAGAEVLLSPLATIGANTLTDPMTIADVLLFTEVSEASGEAADDVWLDWGNADGVMTTGRKVVKAEIIILPDSANSTHAPIHNTRMSVTTPGNMTWAEWATAGGLFETEGGGPTTLSDPNSVAGDSSDTLVWQYDSGSDSWSAKFGSDATAAGVNVVDTSASGYQDIPGTNLREQWGVTTGAGATFPAPFKTGTVPAVIPVALSAGDNQNVSLQSVNHTGFNTWVVRNENDVGITTPTIHWVAKGEKP